MKTKETSNTIIIEADDGKELKISRKSGYFDGINGGWHIQKIYIFEQKPPKEGK
jgi:hypothetical protein